MIAKDWEERAQALEAVRLKLRSGWRNDDNVLEQYFQSCVQTWKLYTGPWPPKKVLKLQGVYKQALLGDCLDAPPADLRSVEGVKWSAWHGLRGMDASTAKRRFITLLSEIDPLLIDVMPDEKPPAGDASLWPAWTCVSHAGGRSHPGTPNLSVHPQPPPLAAHLDTHAAHEKNLRVILGLQKMMIFYLQKKKTKHQ